MANELQLAAGLKLTNPAPADAYYCLPQVGQAPAQPYESPAQACAYVPQPLRYQGLTVNVAGIGEMTWPTADLSNNGLVAKAVPGSGGGSGAPLLAYAFAFPVEVDGAQSFPMPAGTAGIFSLQAQTEYNVLRPISPSHYQLSGGNLVISAAASLAQNETVEGTRYTGGSTGGSGSGRDTNNVTQSVRDAVRDTGHIWAFGDLTDYASTTLQAAALNGTQAGDYFDDFELNSQEAAYRYTYCQQNGGAVVGWTRLPKPL